MLNTSLVPHRPLRLLLVAGVVLIASSATAQSIDGTATYRERMALPAGAVFEAVLEDVSRADAPAVVIGRTRVATPGNPPIAFTIPFDRVKIVANRRYAVRARILVDGKLLFTTDTANPVVIGANPTSVSLVLRRVGGSGSPPAPAAAAGNRPLEGTYWRAIELAGKPTPPQDPANEAHLQFQAARVSGSDGCNRVVGSFQRTGDRVSFGQLAGTQMACLNSTGTERAFHDALQNASRLTIAGERLELFNAAGRRLAVFAGSDPSASASPSSPRPSVPSPPSSSSPPSSPGFAGTSWQLVQFEGSDDTTLKPDDRTKYTIEFAAGGRLNARIDCNRGSGTWMLGEPSQIRFGPLALTRAQCPPGSLHDQIVRQWGNIRSYVMRDGHLFLALLADGGIYEFEPIGKKKPQ